MRCEKWTGSKVRWKFNDPLGLVRGMELKSSVGVFSMYLSCVERAVACIQYWFVTSNDIQRILQELLQVPFLAYIVSMKPLNFWSAVITLDSFDAYFLLQRLEIPGCCNGVFKLLLMTSFTSFFFTIVCMCCQIK